MGLHLATSPSPNFGPYHLKRGYAALADADCPREAGGLTAYADGRELERLYPWQTDGRDEPFGRSG